VEGAGSIRTHILHQDVDFEQDGTQITSEWTFYNIITAHPASTLELFLMQSLDALSSAFGSLKGLRLSFSNATA